MRCVKKIRVFERSEFRIFSNVLIFQVFWKHWPRLFGYFWGDAKSTKFVQITFYGTASLGKAVGKTEIPENNILCYIQSDAWCPRGEEEAWAFHAHNAADSGENSIAVGPIAVLPQIGVGQAQSVNGRDGADSIQPNAAYGVLAAAVDRNLRLIRLQGPDDTCVPDGLKQIAGTADGFCPARDGMDGEAVDLINDNGAGRNQGPEVVRAGQIGEGKGAGLDGPEGGGRFFQRISPRRRLAVLTKNTIKYDKKHPLDFCG